MRVLITGASGYFGSYLTKTLINLGVNVSILKRESSELGRLSEVIDKLKVYNTSKKSVSEAFNSTKTYDAVIHAATCYGRNNESWNIVNDSNVGFPLLLLEESIKSGVKYFINIGTVLSADVNVYSLSKQQFVEWGEMSVQTSTSFQFINARLENIYGPGDDHTKFVTAIITQCLENVKEIKLTKGEQKRDFIYIEDAVLGVVKLLYTAIDNDISNSFAEFDIGSGHAISIRTFVELIHKISNSKSFLNFGAVPYRYNEFMESMANTQPIKSMGWDAKYTLEDGLLKTISMERLR